MADSSSKQIDAVEEDAILGADDQATYNDDASSLHTDTTSLSSSVTNYQYENGRRYHGYHSGKYALPNDETEQGRLEEMHHLWALVMGGDLGKAPIQDVKTRRALDIGTGTGMWAIDFGDVYPKWEVTGSDLSPIQPKWVPNNVRFEVDDLEESWQWPKEHFGYIHTRNLVGSVQKWDHLFKQAYDHLAPGGYIELHESHLGQYYCDDDSLPEPSAWKEYTEGINAAANIMGRRMDIAPELAQLLVDAGFIDVHSASSKCAVGAWPKDKRKKEIGHWHATTIQTGAEAYGLALFTRVIGKSAEEAQRIIRGVLDEVANPKYHVYVKQYIIYGKKPLERPES